MNVWRAEHTTLTPRPPLLSALLHKRWTISCIGTECRHWTEGEVQNVWTPVDCGLLNRTQLFTTTLSSQPGVVSLLLWQHFHSLTSPPNTQDSRNLISKNIHIHIDTHPPIMYHVFYTWFYMPLICSTSSLHLSMLWLHFCLQFLVIKTFLSILKKIWISFLLCSRRHYISVNKQHNKDYDANPLTFELYKNSR